MIPDATSGSPHASRRWAWTARRVPAAFPRSHSRGLPRPFPAATIMGPLARVAELADAQDSGSCPGNWVEVQVLSRALSGFRRGEHTAAHDGGVRFFPRPTRLPHSCLPAHAAVRQHVHPPISPPVGRWAGDSAGLAFVRTGCPRHPRGRPWDFGCGRWPERSPRVRLVSSASGRLLASCPATGRRGAHRTPRRSRSAGSIADSERVLATR